MSIWGQLLGAAAGLLLVGGPLGALARAALSQNGEQRRELRARKRCERRQVAFTVAAIALAAKMARADGYASDHEFETFQRLFHVEESERGNAERFYRLAKGSTQGFEAYAMQAAELLGPASPTLEDLLEALFLIAVSDRVAHPEELAFLDEVAVRFGFDAATYARIKARYVAPGEDDPYVVLGVEPGASAETIRSAYRALVKRYHPDRHMAEGVPPEFIRVAEERMAAINAAYAVLMRRQAA